MERRRGISSLIGTLVSYLSVASPPIPRPSTIAVPSSATQAAGANLQLFVRERAAREVCRETGLEEREKKLMLIGRVLQRTPPALGPCHTRASVRPMGGLSR